MSYKTHKCIVMAQGGKNTGGMGAAALKFPHTYTLFTLPP